MSKIKILDLTISSIGSIYSALRKTGVKNIEVVRDLKSLQREHLLVIPGNGNFGQASTALDQHNLRSYLQDFISNGGKILGICLGMQILAISSEESDEGVGLNYFKTKVKRFPNEKNLRIPNIGWAEVTASSNPFNFHSLKAPSDFYFSHSYFVEDSPNISGKLTSNNGTFEFCCGIVQEQIIAVQFHPEKSSRSGAKFLDDVVSWANE
jgi:imidazole glycerol phosphate synthase glutamine amidotransferase subunit